MNRLLARSGLGALACALALVATSARADVKIGDIYDYPDPVDDVGTQA